MAPVVGGVDGALGVDRHTVQVRQTGEGQGGGGGGAGGQPQHPSIRFIGDVDGAPNGVPSIGSR